MTRAASIPEFIASLPAMVGYQLDTHATLSLFDDTGAVIVVGVIPDGMTSEQVGASLVLAHQECQDQHVTPAHALLTVHHPHADQISHHIRAAQLTDLILRADLPTPAQWAVDSLGTWPLNDLGKWTELPHTSPYAAGVELLHGRPAPSRDEALLSYQPESGALRDAIADCLPEAVAQATPVATTTPGQWRAVALNDTAARLSDPQPLTGREAADALLALSDPRVRDHLIAAATAQPDRVGVAPPGQAPGRAPDTGHVADLVRHAPPGLISGPATLLAATLFAGGQPPALVQAATLAALADDPTNPLAARLCDAANHPRPPVLADLRTPRPLSGPDPDPVVGFTTGPGRWPDPLAGAPIPGLDPLGGDPLSDPLWGARRPGGPEDWPDLPDLPPAPGR